MHSIGKLLEKIIAHYEKKEYGEAEKAADELIHAYPEFERGHFLKAVILEETGRGAYAEKYYEKSGNRFTLWFRLASELEGSDPERAIQYYDRVSEHDPQNNLLWYNLGNLQEKMGRVEEARASFSHLSLLREVLSRIVIPLGFMILLLTGGRMMIQKGDFALSSVVIASAVFCIFWLKRDGGKAVQMIRKKNKYR